MTIGDTVYLKWRGHWTQFTLQRLHDWQSTATVVNGNGEHTCKLCELISEEAFNKIVLENHREELRKEHAQLIGLWGNGPEKPTKAARRRLVASLAKQLNRPTNGVGVTLSMLKRYGLLNDKQPSNPDSLESSGSAGERAPELPADSKGV